MFWTLEKSGGNKPIQGEQPGHGKLTKNLVTEHFTTNWEIKLQVSSAEVEYLGTCIIIPNIFIYTHMVHYRR